MIPLKRFVQGSLQTILGGSLQTISEGSLQTKDVIDGAGCTQTVNMVNFEKIIRNYENNASMFPR